MHMYHVYFMLSFSARQMLIVVTAKWASCHLHGEDVITAVINTLGGSLEVNLNVAR